MILRKATHENIEEIASIEMDNINHHYYPGSQPSIFTKQDIESMYKNLFEKDSDIGGIYIVERNGSIIAFFNTFFSVHRNAYTYIHLSVKENFKKDFQSIMSVALDYLFGELGYRKVNIYTLSDNDEYLDNLNKSCFKEEAVLREHYLYGGKYVDVIQLGVVKSDYYNNVEHERLKNYSSAKDTPSNNNSDLSLGISPIVDLLSGENIRLASFEEEDEVKLYEQGLNSNYKNFSSLGATTPPAKGIYLQKVSHRNDAFSLNSDFNFCIKTKENNPIGDISLEFIDHRNRNAMIGLAIIGGENRKKGYGTEVISLILNYAFYELNMHRVYAGAFSFNAGSRRLFEKLGFVLEGINRGFVYRNGNFYDEYVMGMLKDDWSCNPFSIAYKDLNNMAGD